MMKIFFTRISPVIVIAALMIGATSSVMAGDPWTSVGSAGTVDEAGAANVQFSAGLALINPTAPAATTVVMRYNVTSTADLDNDGANKYLKVRFRDNGANARVRVSLISYNLSTGSGTTVLNLDSDSYASSSVYQTQMAHDGCWGTSFDFQENAYYIEVSLTRSATTGLPAVGILQVGDVDIC